MVKNKSLEMRHVDGKEQEPENEPTPIEGVRMYHTVS